MIHLHTGGIKVNSGHLSRKLGTAFEETWWSASFRSLIIWWNQLPIPHLFYPLLSYCDYFTWIKSSLPVIWTIKMNFDFLVFRPVVLRLELASESPEGLVKTWIPELHYLSLRMCISDKAPAASALGTTPWEPLL